MSGLRTILACLSDADTAPATLDLALLVGRDYQAHVEALHVRPDAASSIPMVGEGMSGAMVEEMLTMAERQSKDRADRVRSLFEAASLRRSVDIVDGPIGRRGLTAVWREEIGREDDVIACAGRLTDLLVMARPLPDRDVPSILTINAALLESGRPLLLAPPVCPATVGRKVALLWNGSAEASRAVACAMPMLQRADKVEIISATEDDGDAPAQVVGYLAWHDVHASLHSFTAGPQVGQILLDEAAGLGADLIVMGAYTHSRLRQLILGGVTRYVLHAANLPVLLSH